MTTNFEKYGKVSLCLSLITITLVLSFIYFPAQKEKPKTLPRLKSPSKTISNIQSPSQKISALKNKSKSEKAVNDDDNVPWEDLKEEWLQEITQTLIQQGLPPDKEMIKQYLMEKKDFEEKIDHNIKLLSETYSFNAKTNQISFNDKKRYKEINHEIDLGRKEYTKKVKAIFGNYYPELKLAYSKFRDSMQAYYSGEGSIGLDAAFED